MSPKMGPTGHCTRIQWFYILSLAPPGIENESWARGMEQKYKYSIILNNGPNMAWSKYN